MCGSCHHCWPLRPPFLSGKADLPSGKYCLKGFPHNPLLSISAVLSLTSEVQSSVSSASWEVFSACPPEGPPVQLQILPRVILISKLFPSLPLILVRALPVVTDPISYFTKDIEKFFFLVLVLCLFSWIFFFFLISKSICSLPSLFAFFQRLVTLGQPDYVRVGH